MKFALFGLAALIATANCGAHDEGCFDFDCKDLESVQSNVVKGQYNKVAGLHNQVVGV